MIRARCLRVKQHYPVQKITKKIACSSYTGAQQRFAVMSCTALVLVLSAGDKMVLILDLRFSVICYKFKFLGNLGFLQPIYRVLRKISNYRKNFWNLFHQFHQNFSSKWFDVNKLTIVNSLVLHLLHRNIAHLAIKTRKTFLKMEVLVQEECRKFQIAVNRPNYNGVIADWCGLKAWILVLDSDSGICPIILVVFEKGS